MEDPNYIPTLEDKIDDVMGLTALAGLAALVAYGAFRAAFR